MRLCFKIFVLTLAVGTVVRLTLLYVTKSYLEAKLNEQKNFAISIEDVDYSLIRGAIQIEGVNFQSLRQEDRAFANFSRLEINLNYWKSLLNFRIVASCFLDQPTVSYLMDMKPPKEKDKKSSISLELKLYQIRRIVSQVIPFKISSFKIYNGRAIYKVKDEPIEFEVSSLDFELNNLTNDESKNAVAKLSAVTTGEGKIDATLEFDPDSQDLEFDLDAQQGKKFEAYVKPLIKDLDILSDEDLKDESVFGLLWEGIAGLMGNILENHSEDQLGAKIRFDGKLDQPDVDVWQAAESILTNAFVKALAPQLEWEIDFL